MGAHSQRSGRVVYGRVYELFTTRPDLDGEHPYVGQTVQETIHQRVHEGARAHTSATSIAKDEWKSRIRPGREGYRCLKTIYATGDPQRDQLMLDMAEAYFIDALATTYNTVRPVRPPVHTQPATGRAAVKPVSTPARSKSSPARQRQDDFARIALSRERWGFRALWALATAALLWLLVPLPWPWSPTGWLVAPVLAYAACVWATASKAPRHRRRR